MHIVHNVHIIHIVQNLNGQGTTPEHLEVWGKPAAQYLDISRNNFRFDHFHYV